jgi:hypothetical protein
MLKPLKDLQVIDKELKYQGIDFVEFVGTLLSNPNTRANLKSLLASHEKMEDLWVEKKLLEIFDEDTE